MLLILRVWMNNSKLWVPALNSLYWIDKFIESKLVLTYLLVQNSRSLAPILKYPWNWSDEGTKTSSVNEHILLYLKIDSLYSDTMKINVDTSSSSLMIYITASTTDGSKGYSLMGVHIYARNSSNSISCYGISIFIYYYFYSIETAIMCNGC